MRVTWRGLVVGAVVLALVACPFLPSERAYRERSLGVMRAELAALPSMDGADPSSILQTADSSAPYVLAHYTQVGTCPEVQEHYRQAAAAGASFEDDALDRGYHKAAGAYRLDLVIECARGTEAAAPAAPASYGVNLDVPFPYSVGLIGPWLPK